MKKIAIFMMLNMIMVIFTIVNIQPASAQQNTCCIMENSCSLISATECSAINGRNSYAVSCNSVPECTTGCCVTANTCDGGKTNVWCNQNGGSWSSGDCSGRSECVNGVCIVNGICYDGWSKRQCDAAGSGAQFDGSIQDCNSATSLTGGSEGCCITGNSYLRTSQSACNGGRFISGYLCSYSAVTGSNCLPRDHKTCYNGRVYWVDSCGNRENVADDGKVHNSYNQVNGRILSDAAVKNNIGYCKLDEGKLCGESNSGNIECLDMNCDAGESFYIETDFDPNIAMFLDTESVKIERNFLGETYEQQKGNRKFLFYQGRKSGEPSNAPEKENTKIRMNGESWCMLWPQPEWNSGREEANPAQPGSRDYVFRCINGKIEIEPCADYRSGVCIEDCEKDTSGKCIDGTLSASCEDNAWEGCIHADRDKCDDQNLLCRWVRGECVPITPPGNVFWEEDTSAGNVAACESCGSGSFNLCDNDACIRLGDCRSVHLSVGGRLWRGALIVGGAFLMGTFTLGIFGVGSGSFLSTTPVLSQVYNAGGWVGGLFGLGATETTAPPVDLLDAGGEIGGANAAGTAANNLRANKGLLATVDRYAGTINKYANSAFLIRDLTELPTGGSDLQGDLGNSGSSNTGSLSNPCPKTTYIKTCATNGVAIYDRVIEFTYDSTTGACTKKEYNANSEECATRCLQGTDSARCSA